MDPHRCNQYFEPYRRNNKPQAQENNYIWGGKDAEMKNIGSCY